MWTKITFFFLMANISSTSLVSFSHLATTRKLTRLQS